MGVYTAYEIHRKKDLELVGKIDYSTILLIIQTYESCSHVHFSLMTT